MRLYLWCPRVGRACAYIYVDGYESTIRVTFEGVDLPPQVFAEIERLGFVYVGIRGTWMWSSRIENLNLVRMFCVDVFNKRCLRAVKNRIRTALQVFNQLRQILKKYGFELKNAVGLPDGGMSCEYVVARRAPILP